MSDDRELVELELHAPAASKRFRAERLGSLVTTTTGPAGAKGRTATKDHGTAEAARLRRG